MTLRKSIRGQHAILSNSKTIKIHQSKIRIKTCNFFQSWKNDQFLGWKKYLVPSWTNKGLKGLGTGVNQTFHSYNGCLL